jgi:hypothetical protein
MDENDTQIVEQLDALRVALSQMSEQTSSLPLRDLHAGIVHWLQRCYEMNAANFPPELLHDWSGEYQSGKPVTR